MEFPRPYGCRPCREVIAVTAERIGVILIAGPTASGKSHLALALAEASGGVIINGDSMQVYRELAILTARPDPPTMARVPHRLYGYRAAAEGCNVAQWRDDALAEIAAARAAGQVPIVVGGTGLYFRALRYGLAPVPEIPAAVRRDTRRLMERVGSARFHALLAERDPAMAARLEPTDRQRLARAFEVIEATGTSLAEWQALPEDGPVLEGPVLALRLELAREELYARCDARFAAMVEAGAVEEVQALRELALDPELPICKALGVRELGRYLDGAHSLAHAVAAGQQATRRYAKRQLTWLRHQMGDARPVEAQDSESLRHEIFPIIREFLLTANFPATRFKQFSR